MAEVVLLAMRICKAVNQNYLIFPHCQDFFVWAIAVM